MARANVRISVVKVLDLLRKKAAELQKAVDEYDTLVAKRNKAVEAWKKAVVASVPKSAKPQEITVKTPTWGEYANKTVVEVTYVLDKGVPQQPDGIPYPEKHTLQELQKTIKLLELTDDEYVSTAVYRNISDLL